MRKNQSICIALIALWLGLPLPAILAAEKNMPDSSIPTVIVTANKMEENVQDIPQSISVFDENLLHEKEIKGLSGIFREIPNMSFADSQVSKVNFRGINTSVFTNSHPVVIYVDGIPSNNRNGYGVPLVNVERVEVLRGPQGTLYGKDAIGGIINVITRKATNDYRGNAMLGLGNQNELSTSFALNGPISLDRLFFGVSGRYTRNEGWVENHYPGSKTKADGQNQKNIVLNLHYTPTERLSVRGIYHHDYTYTDGCTGIMIPGSNISDYSIDDAKDMEFDVPSFHRIKSDSGAFSLQYTFDSMIFDAVSTYKQTDKSSNSDVDFGINPDNKGLKMFIYSENSIFTQEFRLSSPKASFLRWIGGLYYEHDTFNQTRVGGDSATKRGNMTVDWPSETTTNSMSAFGQISVPFLQNFEVILGGRYQYIKKEMDLDFYAFPVGGTQGRPMYSLDADHDWQFFFPKASLAWHWDDGLLFYASVSTGYLPGGYNFFATSGTEADNRFHEQSSINYELGTKFINGNITLAANIFYMDIDDIHVSIFNGLTGTATVSNKGKASSYGIEMDGLWHITGAWTVNGSLGLIHARYDEYSGTSSSNTIERTPEYKINLGLQYVHPQGWYGRLDFLAVGSRYFDYKNTLKGDAYQTIDAKIGYRHGNWDMYVFGKNLTDESCIEDSMDMRWRTKIIFADPLTFGCGLRYSF